MAIDLINEVIEHAPASLTAAERYALIVLAEDARLPSREIKHDITDEYLLDRLRMSARSWTNMRTELIKKKAIEKVDGGHNGKKARYKIPIFDEAMKGHPIGDPTEEELGHRSGEPTDLKGHRSGDSRVTDPVTLTYITPSTPSTHPRKTGGKGEETASPEPHPDAVAIVSHLDLKRPMLRKEQSELLALVTAALVAGWTTSNLTPVLDRDWTGVRDRVRAVLARARDLGDAPLPTARASPAARETCPDCHGRGLIYDDETDTTDRCPTCKPRSNP